PIPESSVKYNRILNDEARGLYKNAIGTLNKLLPVTMAKKIARANVQQAFVFDSVYRLIGKKENAKLLCVGSYEDTASWSLRKMGFKVEEIDPVINYYLQDYYTKPTVQQNSYDIIFSTSVIEHDPDDKSFIECIEGLLKPGGVAVITLDYKDGWKPGDLKPDVDERFYTKTDLQTRLLSYLKHSSLIDESNWEDNSNDFTMGFYQYSFASFVFRKK
ncbi:MAG: methyltransferase domain-containing protein, partial [Ferruginibacter sp.]